MKKALSVLVSVLIISQASFAQTSTSTGLTGFRRSLATVMFAGIGGAILGLSTLSFYGEPQEKVGNIWTGLAIGLIGGSAYVLAQSQKSASTAMDHLAPPIPKLAKQSIPIFQYQWDF
jgi:hypothetical protein